MAPCCIINRFQIIEKQNSINNTVTSMLTIVLEIVHPFLDLTMLIMANTTAAIANGNARMNGSNRAAMLKESAKIGSSFLGFSFFTTEEISAVWSNNWSSKVP